MSISKKNGRRQRIGSRRNRRRFAFAERLESRILLDGSGGLGANAADDHAVITNSFDYYDLSYSYNLGLDALAGQLQGDQGRDDGNSVAAGSGDAALHRNLKQVVEPLQKAVEYRLSSDDYVALSSRPSFLYGGATKSDADVIPMPPSSPEFLPSDPNLPHDNWKDIASFGVRRDQSEIGLSKSDDARIAVAESNADASESGDASQATSRRDATGVEPAAIALSSDRYFASYARRTSAGMSTHTAASESRQHVMAAVHHVAPDRGTGDNTPLVSFQSRSVSTSSATGGTAATWWATRAKQVVTASRPDGINQTLDVHLTRLPAESAVAEPDRLDRNFCSTETALGRYRRVRDLAMSLYEQVSFVVGISLVSAHAIAETNAAKKHPSQALRER